MLNYWEEFDGTPFISSHKRPHVTLSFRGVFYFNQFAYKMLGRPQAIAFFFNRAESVIGIAKAPADRRNAFIFGRSSQGLYLAASPFLRRYGIKVDFGSTIKFEDPWIGKEGILRLDLRKVVEAPKRVQKRASRTRRATE